jgi:glycosyltransferase involved in cell wall biosynthesis
MACGLPVVAADASGATNLVRNGVTGTLVEPDEVDEFADALESYARDPQLRRRHGAAGLTFAETMDWDTINSAVLKVYVKAIEKRKRLTRLKRRGLFRLFRA